MKWYLNKLNWLGISIIFTISLFIGHGIFTLIQQSKIDFKENIQRLFIQAISMEKDEKISRNNLFVATTYNKEKSSSNIIIENENGKTYIDKTPSLDDYTIAEKDERMLQTIFRIENPIQPTIIDSFFNAALSQQGISARTAVCYKDSIDHKVLYSITDTTSLSSAYATQEVTTGLDNEICLQGFIFISGWDMLGKAKGHVLVFLIAWIFIIGGISTFLVIYRKKKTPHSETETVTSVELPSLGQQDIIQLTPNVYWNINSSRLMHNNIEVPLTPQHTQLLTLFLNNPEHFATHEEIRITLWGKDGFINEKDRLDRAIARFRKALQSVTEIKIENDRGKGYILYIKDEGSKISKLPLEGLCKQEAVEIAQKA